jgi:hypothetical protein
MSLKIFYLSKFFPNFPNFQRGTCSSRSHSLDRKWLEIPTVKLGSGNQFSLTHSIISKLNFINGERSREFQQPEINKNCTGTPTTLGKIKPHFKPDYFILIHYIIVMIGTHESISQHFQETW